MKTLKAWAVINPSGQLEMRSLDTSAEEAINRYYKETYSIHDGERTWILDMANRYAVQEVIIRTVEDSEARDKEMWARASAKGVSYAFNNGAETPKKELEKFLKEEEES